MSLPPSTRPPSSHPLRAGGWGVAVAATLGMSVSYIDRQTLAAIAPAVRSALALDHTHFGWLVSAFSLAYLVGAPAAGIVVDRLGARRGFALAVIVWSVVAGAHALATSFAALFLLRVLLGAAEAPSFPAAAQAIRRALPGASRPTAYGMLFTGSYIGAMIAAPLALALEARAGFRVAFLGTAALGTVWIPFWLLMTRGDAGEGAREVQGEASQHAKPTRWIDVAKSAPVIRAIVAVIGSAPGLMFVLNWSSQYLVEHWHLARSSIGGYLVVPALMFDVGAVGFGWILSRRPTRTHVDILAISASLAALLALAPLAPSPAVAVVLFGAAACGGGGIYVTATADMLGRVPLDRTSSAGGMTAAAQSLAHVVFGPLIGFAIDRTHGFALVLVVLGLLPIPTTLAFARWPSLRDR